MGALDVWWPYAAAVLLAIELVAVGHAVLNKREPRSALAWVALILLVPVLGVLLYSVAGVKRINRGASPGSTLVSRPRNAWTP